MPLINLIESRIIAERKAAQALRVSKMVFAGTGAIVAATYALILIQANNIGGQENELREEIKKQKPMVDKIAEMQSQKSDLEPRLKTLTDARDLTGRWGRIMKHLATNTPANVWLTSLRAQAGDPEKPIGLSIIGLAKTQAEMAEFTLRTQNAKDLEAVSMKYSQEKVLEATTAVEFEVGGEIVGTAEKKRNAEGEGAKA